MRAALSELPLSKQEQFIGARECVKKLKATSFSVEASLDCRLEVPLSFAKLDKCNELLARRRAVDKTSQRKVLMRVPTPQHEAYKRGLYNTLFVPSPFRPAKKIRALMRDILIEDDMHVSIDGHALEIDVHQAAAECFAAA